MPLDRATRRAIARYGPSVNHMARKRYGISGQQLLARLVIGESGGKANRTSIAGAKGLTQFMPSSRQEAIRKYGVDPWANPDQAVHGAVLHLKGKINGSTGLEGYNPGDPSYAKYILDQSAPGDLPRGSGGSVPGGGRSNPQAPGMPSVAPAVGDPSVLTALLQQQLEKPARPVSSAPTPPSFAAGPTLARDAIQTNGGPGPKKPDLSGTLSAVASLSGVQLPASGQGVAQGSQSPAGSSTGGNGGQGGKVTVAPGANRAGAPLNKALVGFVKKVSAIDGRPLTIGTGTNHSQMTVNGNVSDHWDGNGADVPLTGKALLRAGRAALVAAGMNPEKARHAKGGLYNVGGWQIIFSANGSFGDHTTHLHVGRSH